MSFTKAIELHFPVLFIVHKNEKGNIFGQNDRKNYLYLYNRPASVAQSEVHLTGDQVTGHIHSVPSTDMRRAFVSFWQKNVHKYWLNAFEDLACPGKCVAR